MTVRSGSLRLLTGGLAAVWLALPAATAVHGAVEVHAYCVEHQAFEHGVDTPATTDSRVPESSAFAVDATSAHESCAFDDALLRDAPSPVSEAARAASAPTAASACAGDSRGAVARDVLASAPKTSPPVFPTV